VLFADLVGFTSLSATRDPETVRELQSHYFERTREIVGRYGGVVEKFIGDAVMALWGAPTAHEDDAERAVRAALDLVEMVPLLGREMKVDLQLRAGVLTGEAAVGVGAEGEGMVTGDMVNTASRLQSAAAPGTVLVGEATRLAAGEAIAFESAGDQVLKGKAEPVPAWRAMRVVADRGGRTRSSRHSSAARRSSGSSRSSSTPRAARVAPASSRSWARQASARVGSRGSWRSTSTGSLTTSGGTAVGPPRMARASPSGR